MRGVLGGMRRDGGVNQIFELEEGNKRREGEKRGGNEVFVGGKGARYLPFFPP